MYKKITFIAGLLTLLILPHLTHAQDYEYIPSSSFFDAFAKPRTAESLAAEQQRRSAERREAEQAAAFAAQRGEEEETLYGSASEETQTSTTTTNTTAEDSFISPETLSTLRLIERIQQQQQEAELRNKALSILGADLNLHGGADLSGYSGKGVGKGEVIGKGETVPQFLPTQTTVLAPVGASSVTVLIMLLLGAIATGAYYLKGGKAVIVE